MRYVMASQSLFLSPCPERMTMNEAVNKNDKWNPAVVISCKIQGKLDISSVCEVIDVSLKICKQGDDRRLDVPQYGDKESAVQKLLATQSRFLKISRLFENALSRLLNSCFLFKKGKC